MPTEHLRTELKSVINEQAFSAVDIMKNPIHLSTLSWTTGQAAGDYIGNFEIPKIFTLYSSMQLYILSIFTFFKPTVRLHFKLNSNRFQQGLVIVSYDPFRQHRNANRPDSNGLATKFHSLTAATCLPHIYLDASKSNEGYLDIPFEHVQSYLTTNSAEVVGLMGLVRVMVLNPLKVGTGGTPSAGLQVFMSCVDIDLHVPIFPHTPIIPSLRKVKAQMFEDVIGAAKAGYSSIWNVISGNFSSAAEQASKFFGSATNILRSFNLDKPNMLDTAVQSMIYPVEPFGHMDGLSGAVTLGVNPTSGYLHHSEFSLTKEEEYNIGKIAGKYSGFAFGENWDTTQSVGTIIAKYPVMPRLCPQSLHKWAGQVPTSNPKCYRFEHTWLSYITSLFAYWCGDIKYKVQFVSTDFQTGRLGAAFVPNTQFPESVPSFRDLMQCEVMLMDLKEDKEFEFTIKYQSSIARKISTQYTLDTTGVRDVEYDDRFSMGSLYFFIINPLVAPGNVASNIEFNLYHAAGDNFKWEVPTLENFAYSNPVPLVARKVEAQMWIEDRTSETGDVNALTKGSGINNSVTGLGQEIRDVRALAKRMSLLNSGTYGMGTYDPLTSSVKGSYGSVTYPVSPTAQLLRLSNRPTYGFPDTGFYPVNMNGGNYSDPSIGNTWMLAIARMYALWHGGIRYSFVSDPYATPTSTASGIRTTAYIQPRAYSVTSGFTTPSEGFYLQQNLSEVTKGSGSASMFTANTQQRALTVTVPYMSAYNQLITETDEDHTSYKTDSFYSGRVVFSMSSNGDNNELVYYELYGGGADDLAFSYLTAPPATFTYTVPENGLS